MIRRISTRIWQLAGLSVAAIGLLSVVVVFTIRDMRDASHWVERTEAVLAAVAVVAAEVNEAETVQRGYLLTGQKSYLEAFDEKMRQGPMLLDPVLHLTMDNPLQRAQIAELNGLIGQKYKEMSDIVDIARKGNFDAAILRVRTGVSGQIMDHIRHVIDNITALETGNLKQRKLASDDSQNISLVVAVGGGGLAILLVLLVSLRVTRLIGGRVDALLEGINAFGDGQVDVRIAIANSHDEIGLVAGAFNRMAEHLAEANRVRDHAIEEMQHVNETLVSQGDMLIARSNAIDVLGKMAHRLQVARTDKEFSEVVGLFAERVFEGIPGGLYVFNASRNLLVTSVSWNGAQLPETITPDDCWALRRGQTHIIRPNRNEVHCQHVPTDVAVYSCLPLIAHGDVIGLLYLEAAAEGEAFDYVPAVAENIALALVNHRLRNRLQEMSIRDPLTGLFNHRYMEEALSLEFARSDRSGSSVGVVMMDIDHFKAFNDDNGHEAGDLVLRQVAATLAANVRGGDLVCRYGGEELTVIMPGADLDLAMQRAEILRAEVAQIAVTFKGQALAKVTISAGVAVFPDHGTTQGSVISAADAALYSAKTSGRNRVVAARIEQPPLKSVSRS